MHTFNGFNDRLTETIYRIHFEGQYDSVSMNPIRLSCSLKAHVQLIVAASTPPGPGLEYVNIALDAVDWVAIASRMIKVNEQELSIRKAVMESIAGGDEALPAKKKTPASVLPQMCYTRGF